MKRYTVISAAALALAVGAFAAPVAGASSGARTPHRTARHSRAESKRAQTVSFYATVVRASAQGLVVRTANGRTLRFSAAQIAHRRSPATPRNHHRRLHSRRHLAGRAADISLSSDGPVVVNIVGLQPGVTVLITETTAPDGTVTITITLPPSLGGQQTASGVVSNVGDDTFDLTTGDGADLRLHMSADQLSALNLQECDTADVTYHQDAGMLIADNAQVTGASTSGDCAPTYDANGPITQVSDTSISINSDQGPMTFSVGSPDITGGFNIGDVVDVTYTQNGDGSLQATDVEFAEQDVSGVVTSVSPTQLTITDDSTGQTDTFTADPNNGLQLFTYAFDGVHVGDQLDVTYHQSAAGLVADSVNDQGAAS